MVVGSAGHEGESMASPGKITRAAVITGRLGRSGRKHKRRGKRS